MPDVTAGNEADKENEDCKKYVYHDNNCGLNIIALI